MRPSESQWLFWLLVCSFVGASHAQVIEWDNGGGNMNWTSALNWAPNGLPGSGNEVIIGNLANAQNDETIIDRDFTVKSLHIEGFASANTAGNLLRAESVNLGFAGELIVTKRPDGPSLEVFDLTVSNFSNLQMNGGEAIVAGILNSTGGGFVSGHGHIEFTDSPTSASSVFVNNGTFSSSRPTGVADQERYTLQLSGDSANARLDLDGVGNNRSVIVGEQTTMRLGVRAFNHRANMFLNAGSIFDSHHAFQVASTGIVHVDAETTLSGVAEEATIRGGGFVGLSGATLNINSGALNMDTASEFNPISTINVAGGATLRFNETSRIRGNLEVGQFGTLEINSNVVVENANLDWDGTGTSVSRIGTGGRLEIAADSVDPADGQFHDSVQINGGTLVTNFANTDFVIGAGLGSLIMDATTGTSRLEGSDFVVNGSLRAQGTGVPRIVTATTFNASGNSQVDADADLFFTRGLTFNGGSSHTGSGEISIGSDTIVNGDTMINMPDGIYQLDSNQGNQTMTLNADFIINARTLRSEVGRAGFGNYTIHVANNHAKLFVNLTDANDAWTLGGDGVINVNGADGNQTAIDGSDVNVLGRINVNRTAQTEARMNIEDGGVVFVSASKELYMNGGSNTNPHQLNGGSILGAGTVSSTAGLRGYGRVATPLNFVNGADLVVDGGVLFLENVLQNAHEVVIQPDATLFTSQPLDTSRFASLNLLGGTLDGVLFLNHGRTEGHGSILSGGLTNTGDIIARNGDLFIDTANAPDLDGGNVNAMLHAMSGNIRIADVIDGLFDGVLRMEPGNHVEFMEAWALGRSGLLQLFGTANNPSELKGNLASIYGKGEIVGESIISSRVDFNDRATMTLADSSDRLTLENNAVINQGAVFEGDGRLRVVDPGQILLRNGAVVGVHVENEGDVFASSFGVSDLRSYEQSENGTLVFPLQPNGTGLLRFDDNAILDGELSILLTGTYNPSLGDSFELIQADRVIGEFTGLSLPSLDPGLDWLVDYGQTDVKLSVIEMIANPGDFDRDGDYSCADVDLLVSAIVQQSSDLEFDLTGDGNVNQQDLDAWLAEAGAAELNSGQPYLYGDANLDSVVDASDFNIWNGNKFTSTSAWCSGDFNADGSVDTSDFNIWNSNKFQSANAGASVVPEPTAFVLACLGLVGVQSIRRRKR